jgi:hypothetical protein
MSHLHVEVVYRMDPHGNPIPLQFVWEGRLHNINDIGREWQEDNERHMLVRVSNGQVYELIHNPISLEWFIKLFPQPPQAA